MFSIQTICVSSSITIREALEKIDQSGRHILIVVDFKQKLKGTITDGDIRRSLLKDMSLDCTIENIYNKNPIFCFISHGRNAALKLMNKYNIDQIPMVDANQRVVGLETYNANTQGIKVKNPVIIMAGGLGTRLRPITEHIPKALTPITNRPILEIIINKFVSQGFTNFYLCVNYKAQMIEDHFKDGSAFNANIQYIYENQQLGTAGALSKLAFNSLIYPCIVTNCDVLTTVNYSDLIDQHLNEGADFTVATRKMSYEIPYGVVYSSNNKLYRLQEKPIHQYEINAGIYILNKKVMQLVSKDSFFNMTDLIQCAVDAKMLVLTYPIYSYWIDIGDMEYLEKARNDYDLLNI